MDQSSKFLDVLLRLLPGGSLGLESLYLHFFCKHARTQAAAHRHDMHQMGKEGRGRRWEVGMQHAVPRLVAYLRTL